MGSFLRLSRDLVLYSFYCLLIGIVLLPLKKVLFLPIVEYKILLADFFFLLSGCIAVFETEARERILQLRYFLIVVFFFLLWVTLSSFISIDSFSTAVFTQLEILALFYNVGLLLLIFVVANSPEKIFYTLLGWVVAILISNLLAIYSLVSVPNWGFSYGILIGSFVGANQPQILLLPLFPLLIFVGSLKNIPFSIRIASIFLSCSSVLFVLISGSRSGFFMLALEWGCCFFVYWRVIKRRFSYSSITFWGQQATYALLLLIVLLFGTELSQTYAPLAGLKRVNRTFERVVFHKYNKPVKKLTATHYDRLSSGRIGIIKAGYSLFKENIFTGYGLQRTRRLKGAHNHEMHCSYLVLLFETGVIGLLLGTLMMWMVLKRVQIALKNDVNSVETLVLQALLIGLASLALYNLFTNGLRQRETWVLLGMLLSLTYVEESVSGRNNGNIFE